MRSQRLWASIAAIVAFGLIAPPPATAGDSGYRAWDGRNDYAPAYHPTRKRTVSGYYVTDPYAYRYEPRGYYPYYDSGYWRPNCGNKINCVPVAYQSPYWKAWGYPKPWPHYSFHRVYHGRIRPWHW